MLPEEFISRCFDVYFREVEKHAYTKISVMEALLRISISSDYNRNELKVDYIDNEFTIEFSHHDGMWHIATEMRDINCQFRACLVYSTNTHKYISHWVYTEEKTTAEHLSENLVLLKLASQDILWDKHGNQQS